MKHYTTQQLIDEGYMIENAIIKSADISFTDGYINFNLVLEGYSWGCNFGGFSLGTVDGFKIQAYKYGLQYVSQIIKTIGVWRLSDLNGRYLRVARKHGESLCIIGNILTEDWFDAHSFFEDFIDENHED